MFRKVLVANRGEIALRVFRACRELGIGTVAVYSEADVDALHATHADEAFPIGPAPARESYLRHDRILEAARRAGVCAIHPGYGFLSEDAGFARAVQAAGFVFIGPSPEAMEAMGRKTSARALMEAANVSVVPGHPAGTDEELIRAAEAVGYPLLVKAAAGGGGKGMRVCPGPDELPGALSAARTEARQSFGDDTVYLERYLEQPRHIEVQVLGDCHGALVHLFERECSVQRRHQKIVEETPSVAVDDALRAALGEAAVRAARAVSYVGAGTVEFLLDADGSFYFLEMNTRLQVEHPITELTTGIDLVKAQLRIAAGAPLGLEQAALAQRGHAIECRIYAEDPEHDFRPSSGVVHFAEAPLGPHVRVDTGIATGETVPIHYDPLLSKLICWGETRAEALRTMREALRSYAILGPVTNLEFLLAVLGEEAFEKGAYDTRFVDEHLADWRPPGAGEAPSEDALILAAVADHLGLGRGRTAMGTAAAGADAGDRFSPWRGPFGLPEATA